MKNTQRAQNVTSLNTKRKYKAETLRRKQVRAQKGLQAAA